MIVDVVKDTVLELIAFLVPVPHIVLDRNQGMIEAGVEIIKNAVLELDRLAILVPIPHILDTDQELVEVGVDIVKDAVLELDLGAVLVPIPHIVQDIVDVGVDIVKNTILELDQLAVPVPHIPEIDRDMLDVGVCLDNNISIPAPVPDRVALPVLATVFFPDFPRLRRTWDNQYRPSLTSFLPSCKPTPNKCPY